jgi:hypothetical protein
MKGEYNMSNSPKQFNSERKPYGVFIDKLVNFKKSLKDRVDGVRADIQKRGYKDLDEQAKVLYDSAVSYEQNKGVQAGKKPAKLSGKRAHLLYTAKGFICLVYQYKHVAWEVRQALEKGTPVWVFSPYKVPDMVRVLDVEQWQDMLAAETESNQAYGSSQTYKAWLSELSVELTTVLNTEIPWLCPGWKLVSLARMFNSDPSTKEFNDFDGFSMFMDYVEDVIGSLDDSFEYETEWDTETTTSLMLREKMSTAHFIANKGLDKGQMTFWCTDKPSVTKYWSNYESLVKDRLVEFLHLTYLKAIDYKPMIKMYTSGVDYTGRKVYFGESPEEELTPTPIYVDPYESHTVKYGFNLSYTKANYVMRQFNKDIKPSYTLPQLPINRSFVLPQAASDNN